MQRFEDRFPVPFGVEVLPSLQQAALLSEAAVNVTVTVEADEIPDAGLDFAEKVAIVVQTVVIKLIVNMIHGNFGLFQRQPEERVLIAVIRQGFVEAASPEYGFGNQQVEGCEMAVGVLVSFFG